MSLHKNLQPENIHLPYAFVYNNASERTSATGFLSSDVGKLARQLDDNSLWMLTAVTPAWVGVGGADEVTVNTHKGLRQLIHLADGGGPYESFGPALYREITPTASPFPTSVIWYTDATKTYKILEENYVYNPNKTISTITWKVYDTDGTTILVTAVDTINYSGVFEINRIRTVI
jgi:hypothetical protein